MKHLLKMLDLEKQEILELLDSADQLKYEQKNNIAHAHLAGKSLGMIFQKASTRTRVSFEVGMAQLGGYPLYLSANDLQIGRGEPVQDTARVLSRYLDGIMIRTFEQQEVEDLAKFGNIPIVNGLTDYAHPCQILADLMTIREYKQNFENQKLCYIGDGNNVANSLIVGALKVGMCVTAVTPAAHKPHQTIMDFAAEFGEKFKWTDKPIAGAACADVVYTDVWASMGQEKEMELRKKEFAGFQVNDEVMAAANSECMVLHCLPAHREEEITEKVLEQHIGEILEEAENRMHAQKAVLVKLMG